MPGRPAKKRVHVNLDEEDYLWAITRGFDFSERFSDFLKFCRRETELATYGLVLKRQPPTVEPEDAHI